MTAPSGVLASVMLRALAAELSDPGRFRRADAYARDGAVLDLEVHAGELRGLVRGSRFEPYQAQVWVDPPPAELAGQPLVPRRHELWAACTCPDGSAGSFCKHTVATLLVFADEVSIAPAALVRWRSEDDADVPPATPVERTDILAELIAPPAPIPQARTLPRRLPVAMARHDEVSTLVADVLNDALAHLRTG